MLGAKSDGILIGRKSMGHLSTNSCVSKGIDIVIVGCTENVTFIIPAP